MKTKRTLIALLAALCVGAAGATPEAARAGERATQAKAKRMIEGTWRIEATPDPPPPGAPPAPPPFFGIITFAQGGALMEANTAYKPTEATPGIGSWEFVSGRTFRYTFYKLIYDAEGHNIGVLEVIGTFEVTEDGQSMTATPFRVNMLDPAGEATIFSATGICPGGKRLIVEPT